MRVGTTNVRFWWTNTAFFSPPHLKTIITKCHSDNCIFLGGYYLADMGTYFMDRLFVKKLTRVHRLHLHPLI